MPTSITQSWPRCRDIDQNDIGGAGGRGGERWSRLVSYTPFIIWSLVQMNALTGVHLVSFFVHLLVVVVQLGHLVLECYAALDYLLADHLGPRRRDSLIVFRPQDFTL